MNIIINQLCDIDSKIEFIIGDIRQKEPSNERIRALELSLESKRGISKLKENIIELINYL